MDKLNIFIASDDVEYSEKVTELIINRYTSRFHVFRATASYLENNTSQLDNVQILLLDANIAPVINPDMFRGVTIILEGEKKLHPEVGGASEKIHYLFKYQDGESLINNILDIYSRSEGKLVTDINHNTPSTHVMAVYSPLGGIGKTTVALGVCVHSARRGLKTLYLNFNGMNFVVDEDRNFSRMLVAIDDIDAGLLEALRRKERSTGLYYYTLPDSCLEFSELAESKITNLFQKIIGSGLYDVIVLDLSSEFNGSNLALMNLCDNICFLAGNNPVSEFKIKRFEEEINVLGSANTMSITEKLIFVINNNSGLKTQAHEEKVLLFRQDSVEELPYCSALDNQLAGIDILNYANCEFNAVLARLLNRMLL